MFVSFQFQYLKKKSGIYLRDGTYPAKEGRRKSTEQRTVTRTFFPVSSIKKFITDISGTVKSKKLADIEYLCAIVDPSVDIKNKMRLKLKIYICL